MPASADGLSVTRPSWLAATASMNVTTGVAMPSLSPLSTLSARRNRSGTRRSLITCALSAASVGARAAPRNPARAHGNESNIRAATMPPRAIDSGRPMPRSRTGSVRS